MNAHKLRTLISSRTRGGRIYCDYAAASPLDARVLRAMRKAEVFFANPSSLHEGGVRARRRIDAARAAIAPFFHALPDEIIFTSGGTEGNALAIFGAFAVLPKPLSSYHAVTTAIEHPSVLEAFRSLEKKGLSVTYVNVDETGHVSARDIVAAIKKNTMLVSVMHVNNEIGTIQPIVEIGRTILKIRKTHESAYPFFHVDACQGAGLIPMTTHTFHADFLTITLSKLYGPKGAGILYARRNVPLSPLFAGGNHERGIRPGTENLPAILGAEEAIRVTETVREKEYTRLSLLRSRFLSLLSKTLSKDSYHINGDGEVSPHIVNISFVGCNAEEILFRLDAAGISVGTKSACQSEDEGLSYVVKALGTSHDPRGAVRFSFGRGTTRGDITRIARALKGARAISFKPIN